MRVNPLAQRDLRPARVSRLAAVFDLEQMGAPTVSARGDWYYVIDGQHRVEALKQWLGTWQDQQIQCWTYEGLTEAQEAEVFLKLNDVLAVPAFAKFKVSVQAGRSGEADVDRIVRALGLRIAPGRAGGGICAVATLRRVYARGGAAVLSKALRIIRDAYGEAGMDGPVIDGIGLLCQRYDGQLVEQRAIDRLAAARSRARCARPPAPPWHSAWPPPRWSSSTAARAAQSCRRGGRPSHDRPHLTLPARSPLAAHPARQRELLPAGRAGWHRRSCSRG